MASDYRLSERMIQQLYVTVAEAQPSVIFILSMGELARSGCRRTI